MLEPLVDVFGTLTDTRKRLGKRYALKTVMTVIFLGLLSGENSARGIAAWVWEQRWELSRLDTVLIRWREHWHIENKLHWVRDVVMGEDASHVRRGQAPQVLAALRNAVITLVKAFGFDSVTQARRHYALNFHEAVSIVC